MSHDALRGKIQEARIEYNTQLRNRFDGKLNHLDSGLTRRFRTRYLLDFFKGCEDFIGSEQRSQVALWLRMEYDKHYQNHVSAPTEASGPASHAAGTGQLCEWHHCAQEAEERIRLIFQRPRKLGRGG